jgi:hypothetical protein
MNTVAVIATGKSLKPEHVEAVRHMPCLAVSDAYRLAPWALALVSQDKAWWRHHKPVFAGRRFCGQPEPNTEQVSFTGLISVGTNSALLACHVAVTEFKAKRILLLGVDMQGTHFFGPHPAPLKNTTPQRFEQMKKQFQHWQPKGVEVWNCNPASALECFPKMTVHEAIDRMAESPLHAA